MKLPKEVKPVIFGCEGTVLTAEEQTFFQAHQPYGFILFARNIDTPEQVQSLTASLRACVGRDDVPILIDQEGGKVARLKPPHFRDAPAAQIFAEMALTDIEKACEACYQNASDMGKELLSLGINVNCAPIADLLFEDAHDIIGSRSFGSDPDIVSRLARSMAKGLQDQGVTPIVKHIPGHGRASVDSHEGLPVVTTSLETLEKSDFIPFKQLCDLPWAMTAHIVFTALDAKRPVTLSSSAIEYIRSAIGFKGIIVTDDLSMKALEGSFADKVHQSLAAGCDIVLHCNGNMQEMQEIAEALEEEYV